jgi:putative colanic acid biosynthesis acetyltransferase WcaB
MNRIIYKEDVVLNKNNTKGLFLVLFYRISHAFSSTFMLRLVGFPVRSLYRLIVIWLLGCDLPDKIKAGKGLRIYHGQGLVINKNTIIGSFVTLRQNTTIGIAKSGERSPCIEDFVDVGANSVIIGDITIGKGSVIAAGAVVCQDVPPNSLFAGNPAVFKKTY